MRRIGAISRLALVCTLAAGVATGVAPAGAETGSTAEPAVLHLADAESPPAASISSVAWIAGSWSGDALGGTAEEIWSAPDGGAMMGVFRLVREGKTSFYEILTIAEHDGSLILRLKHFNPDLTGWEEKDEVVSFPLVRVESSAAFFDGMTFVRNGDRMTVAVASRENDGSESKLVFRYARR